jgi:hypothetical protein
MNEQQLYSRVLTRLELLQREGGTSFRLEETPQERVIRVSSERPSGGAPVVIEVERDDLLGLTIGEAAHFELYGKPGRDDLPDEVAEWIEAVLRGGFKETIFWRNTEIAKSELRIAVKGSTQRIKYRSGMSSLLPIGRLRKEERNYEAYSRTRN